MVTSLRVSTALMMGLVAGVITPPVAHAEEFVTYEVFAQSPDITAVDVEYTDLARQVDLRNVPLPWRINAAVADAHSVNTTLHVTWRPPDVAGQTPGRYKWVTTRIFSRGSLLCEAIRDNGNATCTGKGLYKGEIPPFLPPVEPPALWDKPNSPTT